MRKLLTVVSATAIALAATVSGGSPAGAATATHVAVTLREMAITLGVTTVPAGTVTFDVTNSGAAEHEFVILKTDIAGGSLPARAENAAKASEVGNVDELDPVTGTMSLTVELRPGNYVLICNKPGHYAAGMFATLTVSAPAGISVRTLPRSVSAALDMALIARGVEDLSEEDELTDLTDLLTAPGVVVTDADRAAIAAGIMPRAIGAGGVLLFAY